MLLAATELGLGSCYVVSETLGFKPIAQCGVSQQRNVALGNKKPPALRVVVIV